MVILKNGEIMKKYMFIIPLFALATITGCSESWEELQKDREYKLSCHPIEANGCIGFASDKSIMLEDEL
jgi:hypothetical protein